MKNFALIQRYAARNYTPEEQQSLKERWAAKLTDWKNRAIYVSGQVMAQDGSTVRGIEAITANGPADENGLRLGAVVTIWASSLEEAVAIAKESPSLTLNGTVEVREIQQNNKTDLIVFIDSFIVPEDARHAFLERMAINRDFIKSLPGFVEDHAYEKTGGDGKFDYVTVAKWASQKAFDNARKAVGSMYEKQNFNMPDFLKEYHIQLERAIYKEIGQ